MLALDGGMRSFARPNEKRLVVDIGNDKAKRNAMRQFGGSKKLQRGIIFIPCRALLALATAFGSPKYGMG